MPVHIPADTLPSLFDALPDVVFFIKDIHGRYTHVNHTLVQRLRLSEPAEVIGKTTTELFPPAMGNAYAAQDLRVLAGETIANQLEVHLFPNRAPGWCLTFKQPLRADGHITGLIGISRDLGQPDRQHPVYERLHHVLEHMQTHHAEPLHVQALATLARLSVAQLQRHFRRIFQLTPQQLLTKLRIEAAMRLLEGTDSIAVVSMDCGFANHSAFARQFKRTVGMSPRDYRRRVRGEWPDMRP